MVFVTHNLPLVRSIAQKVAVLSEGSIVEYGETAGMLANPQQPYTRQLIANTPSLEVGDRGGSAHRAAASLVAT